MNDVTLITTVSYNYDLSTTTGATSTPISKQVSTTYCPFLGVLLLSIYILSVIAIIFKIIKK